MVMIARCFYDVWKDFQSSFAEFKPSKNNDPKFPIALGETYPFTRKPIQFPIALGVNRKPSRLTEVWSGAMATFTLQLVPSSVRYAQELDGL